MYNQHIGQLKKALLEKLDEEELALLVSFLNHQVRPDERLSQWIKSSDAARARRIANIIYTNEANYEAVAANRK